MVSLLALVPPDLSGKREPVLRAIFASFDFKKDRVATTMGVPGMPVQRWPALGRIGSTRRLEVLPGKRRPSPRCGPMAPSTCPVTGESAHSVSIKNAQGNETAWGVAGSQNRVGGRTGTWPPADGRLTLTFNNGESLGATYEIRPNSAGYPILYLRPDGDKKVSEWTRVN
jgi:hypothetical protein